MAARSLTRTLVSLVSAAVVVWLLWLVRPVLPPFVIALALSFLLDPVVHRLQRRGAPRGLAVTLTFLACLVPLAAFIALLVPRTIAQIGDLLQNQDYYTAYVQQSINQWVQNNAALLERLRLPATPADLWEQYHAQITDSLQFLLRRLFEALQGFTGKLAWLFIALPITFYLLLDLDRFKARVYHVLSPQYREAVFDLSGQIWGVFGAYLRGLLTICLAFGLATFLVLGGAFRLPYALILSLLATICYAVPYLGQVVLLGATGLAAWVTGHSLAYILGALLVLAILNAVFDQAITPRVIGKQVGLHPVLGLFALMVGAHLFGLVGMVVAVPVAASLRLVLVRLLPRLAEPLPEPAPPTPSPPVAADEPLPVPEGAAPSAPSPGSSSAEPGE